MAAWLWVLAPSVASTPEPFEVELTAWRASRMATEAPLIPQSAYTDALSGQITTGLDDVPGSRLRKAWGVAVVELPIDAVWAAVNDNASKTRVTRLTHLELLDGRPCGDDRLVFQYLDIRWLSDRWWVVRQRWNRPILEQSGGRAREMFWRSVEDASATLTADARRWAADGLELPFTEGAWFLVDLGDGRTLMEYFCWSDPGGAVPARLASRFAEGGIIETIEAMATLARSGSGCPSESPLAEGDDRLDATAAP